MAGCRHGRRCVSDRNHLPVTMGLWGLIVAGLLALGFATLLVGLAIVVPVLGHATWHLYRRVVEHDSSPVPTVGNTGSSYVI